MTDVLDRLSHREVWAVDLEFHAPSGGRPEPLCMVAKELRTERKLRVWADELQSMPQPPFSTGHEGLIVAYYASAELGCFKALGWPMPAAILDLHAEHRAATNGLMVPVGVNPRRPDNLLSAMIWRGLDAMAVEEKSACASLCFADRRTTTENAKVSSTTVRITWTD